LLALAPSRSARAQEGPAATMSDEAESNATADAPDNLNKAQQARLQLSAGNRAAAQAEKLDAKAAATTDAKKQADLRAKAKKEFEDAIHDYQAAIKLDPKVPEAYVGLA